MEEDINQRFELVVKPDLIVGEMFFLTFPWSQQGLKHYVPMFFNFRLTHHLWGAVLRDLSDIYKGKKINFPGHRHHVVDRGKIMIKTAPGCAASLYLTKRGHNALILLDKAELKWLVEAMDFHYRRSAHGQRQTTTLYESF